uniref:NAD(P)H-quinone oxidoreductase n=1 Tax=Verdigellas peltata TaxID=542676 RepID=A0A170TNC1_9VIRI|nr:NADH dehydrogenase subunit J [Verdigellas peltata]CZF96657.1 NADH dehydrogenase subunit J [Verdigellas peltata]
MTQIQTFEKSGELTNWLCQKGLSANFLGFDAQGVEIIKVKPTDILSISLALYTYGFNYLRCQFAYDLKPGGQLVSVYYLLKLNEKNENCEEICLKAFLNRKNPEIASVFWIWKTADFQERESYDLFGINYKSHPHLKRILMPENWKGWPMRKDYITPDFYELQDAY